MGTGIDAVLEAIVTRLPYPKVDRSAPFRALLFDCSYDKYRGALSMVFINDGSLMIGDHIQSCYTGKEYEVKTLSVLRPQEQNVNKL